MANWYYVDASGKQVGPISAEELRAAVQSGAASTASLAWRDGLAGWLPISQLRAELGFDGAAAAPASPLPPRVATHDANPYRAPETESAESRFANSDDVVYAGFWRRWAALFLDQVIIGIPLSVVYFLVLLAMGVSAVNQSDPARIIGMELVIYAIWFTAGFFYYVTQESSEAQATFGKRALGIKVTDLSGHRISFKHAAGRWFAAALSYMVMYIGFAMAGFTQRKQALHDMVASTLVVDRWAFTQSPEKQQRGLGGCAIVFIVFIALGLLLIPILAAVVIAQYARYMH